MIHGAEQEKQFRRFLLGQLPHQERQRVEETLMVDSDYREQVLLVEETLIEDYLDGVLPADEQKAFETYFLTSAQQRRKVKIARLLHSFDPDDVPESERPEPPPPAPPRPWSRNLTVRNHPVVFTSLVAALLLLIAFAVFQGVRLWRESSERIAAAKQKLEIERELTQLSNTPAQAVSASTFPLALAPVALRDANEASTLSLPVAAEIVELRLILGREVHAGYRVELSRIGGEETYRIEALHAQTTANGQAVVVRVPSRLLSRGDYKLSLIGIANHGNRTDAGEYLFQVR